MKSSQIKLNFGAKVLWWISKGIALMPRWLRYGVVCNFIYFVLRYVMRYRRKVIFGQLAESFPLKSEAEIEAIGNEYYHTLAESFVGTMSLAAMDVEARKRALKVEVPQHILDLVEGKHFVFLSSHHNLWEYAQFAGLCFADHLTICAYHPLSSQAWDQFYFKLRSSESALPVPSAEVLRYFLSNRNQGVDGKQLLLGLIADQNSPPQGDVHWYDFLNHKTLFFEGGEHLALKFGLPVLYLSMSRVRAGEYRGEVKLVYDGVESVAKHEITERYARLLEQDICREPSRWMWSHRRWKYHPDPVTGEAIYTRK